MTTSKDLCPLSFLAFKNRGHTYIRAYRNVWMPKKLDENGHVVTKARSAPAEQHQVGALLPSGKVKVSKKFLEKFPDFAGSDWYFLNHELVDEETFFANTPDPAESAAQHDVAEHCQEPADVSCDDDDSEDCGNVSIPEVKNFLPHYALAGLAYKNGTTDALKSVFGKDQAMQWRDWAIYQILAKGSADCFEYWAQDQYLSNTSSKMDGRSISKLLQSCSPDKWDKFWKLRFERAQNQSKDRNGNRLVRFCAFDSTSISTYGDLQLAAYGHAKQNPELKQINLATIVDQFTGDIVYAFVYEGSISDKATYNYVYERMESAGFPMNEIMLITDRGYYSAANANEMLKNDAHYLSGAPIAIKSVEERWILKEGSSIQDMPQFWDNVNQVAHITKTEHWSIPNEPTKVTYTHIIYDPVRAQESKIALNNLLTQTLDSLNKSLPVDKQALSSAKPYLKQVDNPDGNPHMKADKIWVFNQENIERHHKRAGFYMIKTDVVSDPVTAVTLYRMREIIEQGFDQLKHQVNGHRLRVQEHSHLGKLFAFVLAMSLRIAIRFNADMHKERVPNSRVEIPSNSLDTLFAKLNRIKVRRPDQKHKWQVDLVPKSVRDWLVVLFRTVPPPSHL